MRSFPFHLRLSITAILVFFVIVLGLFSFRVEILQSQQRAEDQLIQDATSDGSGMAAILEYLYSKGDLEGAEMLVSQNASDPNLELALLIDENNKVLLSSRYALRGVAVADTPAGDAAPTFEKVRQTMAGTINISEGRRYFTAVYPVFLGPAPGHIRSSRIGLLIMKYDLSVWKGRIYADAVRRSVPFAAILFILCVAIWFLFDRIITRRVALLVDATTRVTNGALDVRTELHGSDELAQLSKAFNEMADVIQMDTEFLRKSEERFDLAVRGANDGLWDWDIVTNEVYFSPRWKNMIGYEEHELANNYAEWEKRIHPDDRDRVMEDIRAHLQGLTPHYNCEYRLLHKDGSYRWILSRGLAIRDSSGKPYRMAGSHRDITEQKKTEDENRILQAQMLQAQKLESLGVLAGGIAHDFNNLLTSITGNADLALINLPDSSTTRKPVQRIADVAKRAAELTRQMLAYSGRGRFVVENIDLSDLVKDMMELLKVSIKKNITMNCDLAQNLPRIEADATQIRQVVMNLIINASDAIGEKSGTITVRTGVMECDRAYLNNADMGRELPEGTYIYIDVTDTGCGMDEETKAKIFDPFFTTKFTGRGLGLAAVHGIVRGHKGALNVCSEVGKGTTFRILLPKAEHHIDTQPEPANKEKGRKGGGTILIVDDEEDIVNVTKMMLEGSGFSVLSATDGQKGIELFNQYADGIAAVMLDLVMPNMNGEEALHEMKKIKSDVRVILTSGYNEEDLSNRFHNEGFAGFLQKPYTLSDLTNKIHEVLA